MQIVKIRNFVTVVMLAGLVAGCNNTGDLNAIKEGFDRKPETYEQMMKAANEYAQSGQSEKAMTWYKNAIANAETEFGPGDGRVANAAMYDAAVARTANKLGEAEEMYKKAYDIQLKLSGPNSTALMDVRKAYAETLVADYKLEEARKIYPQVKTPQDNLKSAPAAKPKAHGKH
jgi:thioredoxin-like negative regulator of GroEL